ncbi:hypothetical protein [Acrocarpospora macrocephala]|uniref:hypothetical protein n=1 Tax=Acrocarpospora macrocephala TaxID=150177 RepID=UPI0012D36235|nr:hypothetical protein [Acrocarpospora macrocephala]
MNEEWPTAWAWAAQVEAAAVRALRDVVSTYPFEAGDHSVGPPSSAAELAALHERMPWVPDELFALYRFVGPLSLPDITNGYFLHPPDSVIGNTYHGRADRIGEPFAEDVAVVVFGSNGGGDLYALATTVGGPVYRLQEAVYEVGIYHGTERSITVVGEDLRNFLEEFLAAVEAFADDGSTPISDLLDTPIDYR